MDRLTVAQAAERLGVTQDAVRQRVRRGTIEHERTEDGRVYVYLTEEDAQPDAVHYAVQNALVEELRDRIRYLEEESKRKDAILLRMAERIPELEPASETRKSPERSSETGASGEDRGEEVRRPWWQRIFGG